MNKYLVLFLISLALISCSSNEKKGKEAAQEICKAIKNTNELELIKSLEEIKIKYNEFSKDSKFEETFKTNLDCMLGYSKEISPSNFKTSIKGELSYAFQIVPQNYKIEVTSNNSKDFEFIIKLKIKYQNYIYKNFDWIGGEITLLDKTNYPIEKYKIYRDNAFEKLLKSNLNNEEWLTISLERISPLLGDNALDKVISSFGKILKTNAFELQAETKFENGSSSNSTEKKDDMGGIYDGELPPEQMNEYNNSNSSGCDAALTEYEQFVDEYIQFAEKASEGDLTVMSKAPSLMQKAESSSRKIQNMGQAKLGSSCWEKYLSIQQKLTNAALRMSKNMPKNMDNMQKQMNDIQNAMPR